MEYPKKLYVHQFTRRKIQLPGGGTRWGKIDSLTGFHHQITEPIKLGVLRNEVDLFFKRGMIDQEKIQYSFCPAVIRRNRPLCYQAVVGTGRGLFLQRPGNTTQRLGNTLLFIFQLHLIKHFGKITGIKINIGCSTSGQNALFYIGGITHSISIQNDILQNEPGLSGTTLLVSTNKKNNTFTTKKILSPREYKMLFFWHKKTIRHWLVEPGILNPGNINK